MFYGSSEDSILVSLLVNYFYYMWMCCNEYEKVKYDL